jgi:hypothetical protein
MSRNRRLRGAAIRDFHNRETTWARSVNVFALAANGNYSTLDLLAPFKTDGGNQQGVTVTRTHLNFTVTSAVASTDTFAWGLIKAQNTDVGANVAGAPTPDLDPYEDWLMWRTETAGNIGQPGYWIGNSTEKDFDIRAQRRLPELQMTYNLVIKRLTVAAATLNVVVSVSTLLKLP